MTDQNSSKTRTWLIVGAMFAFVLIAGVIAVLASGSGDGDNVASDPSNGDTAATPALSETQSVTVTGNDLPAMPQTGNDPALGLTMPEISGSSFDGSSVEIRNDGKPKVLIFLAHW